MKVTIIIPLRITDGVYQAESRLKSIIKNAPSDLFDIIIVDYGTPEKYRSTLKNINEENVSIVRINNEDDIFSIGHARDLGVQHSKNTVVMFNDIDFFGSTQMYRRIYNEACSRELHKNAYDFFCVPVFFLTEMGTAEYTSIFNSNENAELKIHRKLYEQESNMIEFPAFGSSAIVVNKFHYLGIGGHSRAFFGHGAEDYDVLHRLSSYYVKGPRTTDYYTNTKSNTPSEYVGFRAYFSLYGLDIFSKCIYFLHLWHPKRVISGYQQTSRNFSILTDLMKQFDSERVQPHPLPNLSSHEKTLVLIDSDSSTFKAIRHVFPTLGQFHFSNENDFSSADELIKYLKKFSIDRVFFLNPYGNDHRLSIYRKIRETGVPYIVFDRGALPDSWFFDDKGFNYDSSSYDPSIWEQSLTVEQELSVNEYMKSLRHSDTTLEENGKRKTAQYLREKYKVGNKSVLFVPFQRPSDTVTNYFAGAAKSVFEFQNWVKFIAEQLPKSEWVIICKNHPLDRDIPLVEGVIYADNDTHIHDLLELADKVLLMNSGVGVLAMAFNKPVICASDAFYCHPGIAYSVTSPGDALDKVTASLTLSQDKVKQFYWHLLNNVYSFGVSKYKKTKTSNGENRNIVQEITFKEIRILGNKFEYGAPPKGVSLDAPLFYSFGGRETIKNRGKRPAATNQNMPPKNITPPPNNVTLKHHGEPIKKNFPSSTKRKLIKLMKNPKLFFFDMQQKRKAKQTNK